MNDDLLFDRLASHGGSAPYDEEFEARLFLLLQRELRRRASAWRPLLVAAGLVVVLAITAVAAIGSGLIAPPWIIPSPTPTISTYVVTADQVPSLGTHRISFNVPEGWTDIDGHGVRENDVSLTVWVSPRGIWVNPCYWSVGDDLGRFADPPFYRSIFMLEAFWDWWGRPEPVGFGDWAGEAQATLPRGTEPTTTEVDGWDARYVEFRVPHDLDVTRCDEGQYRIWIGFDEEIKTVSGPGELNRIWLLKVDLPAVREGGMVMIDASSFPTSSKEDRAELQAMVDSIRIE